MLTRESGEPSMLLIVAAFAVLAWLCSMLDSDPWPDRGPYDIPERAKAVLREREALGLDSVDPNYEGVRVE